MISPDPMAVARMMTLAPTTFRSGTGSGRSLNSTGGRYLLGSVVRLWSATAPPCASRGWSRPPPGHPSVSGLDRNRLGKRCQVLAGATTGRITDVAHLRCDFFSDVLGLSTSMTVLLPQ